MSSHSPAAETASRWGVRSSIFQCDGTDLAEEAFMRGILDLGDRLLLESRSWKALGVRAISIVNELPE